MRPLPLDLRTGDDDAEFLLQGTIAAGGALTHALPIRSSEIRDHFHGFVHGARVTR
jgi:hypothetical protein